MNLSWDKHNISITEWRRQILLDGNVKLFSVRREQLFGEN